VALAVEIEVMHYFTDTATDLAIYPDTFVCLQHPTALTQCGH